MHILTENFRVVNQRIFAESFSSKKFIIPFGKLTLENVFFLSPEKKIHFREIVSLMLINCQKNQTTFIATIFDDPEKNSHQQKFIEEKIICSNKSI